MPIKYSVIVPSYLGEYQNAAKYRVEKFSRAMQSALNQTYSSFEIIVVADGCQKTEDLTRDIIGALKPHHTPFVRLLSTRKHPVFSGEPRNIGISEARGQFILYLDTDDYIDATHIQSIDREINSSDWVWFDDWVNVRGKWVRRKCDINRRFCHGTSNLCHRKELGVFWGGGYEHDFNFTYALKKTSLNFKYINGGEYYVCHIPRRYDI